MMSKYEIRTLSLLVGRPQDPIFSELATTVSIADEAGGEFVRVRQEAMTENGVIHIDPGEWPVLRDAIERMLGECRGGDV
jgi:hypothetical protein